MTGLKLKPQRALFSWTVSNKRMRRYLVSSTGLYLKDYCRQSGLFQQETACFLLYSRNSYPADLIPSTTFSRVRVTSSAVSVRWSAPSVSRKETLFLSGGKGKISRN